MKIIMKYSLFCNKNYYLLFVLLVFYNLINYTSLQEADGSCENGTCDIKDKTNVGDNEQHGKAKYIGII